jgi:tRNA (guanine37-N1)-methyltransferase
LKKANQTDSGNMLWTVLSLFPEMFESVLSASLFGKARDKGLVEVELVNFRDFAPGRHKVVDDAPFGGGAGMLLKAEPLALALDDVRARDPDVWVVLLSPQGHLLDQQRVRRLSGHKHIALVCGRYEGVDHRVCSLVDEEVSIGDFVLSGGEAAAWVVMDAVSRLLPGVVGTQESVVKESFCSDNLLEHPQYTRPREFRGQQVPEVLLSGNHAAIEQWARRQAILRTARRRPDLLKRAELTEEESDWLAEQE